jgi:predicted enzyme related to lactoylglutathione lyase
MIRGVHTMFYTSEAKALREFLRDVFGFTSTDVGDGWLIFDLPEADMGCHPANPAHEDSKSGTHAISFYCDDITKTVAEMKKKGVKFDGPVVDQGFGLVTHFQVPGGFSLQLYQPKYAKKARKSR